MSGNKFLDTNILVYAFDRNAEDEKTSATRELIEKGLMEGMGVISTQVLQEFYSVMTKRINTPLEPAEAKRLLEHFDGFHLVIIDQERIYRAIDLCDDEPLSFWDALIVSAAEGAGCDQVFTEDLNHEQTYGNITAVNPFLRNDLAE